jgi:hypothetical protein
MAEIDLARLEVILKTLNPKVVPSIIVEVMEDKYDCVTNYFISTPSRRYKIKIYDDKHLMRIKKMLIDFEINSEIRITYIL